MCHCFVTGSNSVTASSPDVDCEATSSSPANGRVTRPSQDSNNVMHLACVAGGYDSQYSPYGAQRSTGGSINHSTPNPQLNPKHMSNGATNNLSNGHASSGDSDAVANQNSTAVVQPNAAGDGVHRSVNGSAAAASNTLSVGDAPTESRIRQTNCDGVSAAEISVEIRGQTTCLTNGDEVDKSVLRSSLLVNLSHNGGQEPLPRCEEVKLVLQQESSSVEDSPSKKVGAARYSAYWLSSWWSCAVSVITVITAK